MAPPGMLLGSISAAYTNNTWTIPTYSGVGGGSNGNSGYQSNWFTVSNAAVNNATIATNNAYNTYGI